MTKVYLSQSQMRKLKDAKENIKLKIDKSEKPNYDLPLTKTQINQISKGKRILISVAQLRKIQRNSEKHGGALLKNILSQIKPEIYNELVKHLDIPKVLEEIKKHTFGSGNVSYSNIKKQYGGLLPEFFNILDKFKKQQPKLFRGFLLFLISILTSLGLGAASGVGAWGTKKNLDKLTGSGV